MIDARPRDGEPAEPFPGHRVRGLTARRHDRSPVTVGDHREADHIRRLRTLARATSMIPPPPASHRHAGPSSTESGSPSRGRNRRLQRRRTNDIVDCGIKRSAIATSETLSDRRTSEPPPPRPAGGRMPSAQRRPRTRRAWTWHRVTQSRTQPRAGAGVDSRAPSPSYRDHQTGCGPRDTERRRLGHRRSVATLIGLRSSACRTITGPAASRCQAPTTSRSTTMNAAVASIATENTSCSVAPAR